MEARKLGDIAANRTPNETDVVVWQRPSTEDWMSFGELTALPERLTDTQLAKVSKIADYRIPKPQPCDPEHFQKCMRVIDATLPKRDHDESGGMLFVNAYARMLGMWPREAIDYLASHAINNCRWFPTIAECNDILAMWTRTDEAYRAIKKARAVTLKEKNARFDETIDLLRDRVLTQDQVDTLPDATKRIAMERGYLHYAGGAFIIRHEPESPLRVEPPKPPATARVRVSCMLCQDVRQVMNNDGDVEPCECAL